MVLNPCIMKSMVTNKKETKEIRNAELGNLCEVQTVQCAPAMSFTD